MSYDEGKDTAEKLDAVLLAYDGEGHTVFGVGIDRVGDAITTYLVELQLPGGKHHLPGAVTAARCSLPHRRHQARRAMLAR